MENFEKGEGLNIKFPKIKMPKIKLKTIGIALWVLATLGLVFWTGWNQWEKWLRQDREKYLKVGALGMVDQIFNIVKRQNWILLKNSQGEIMELNRAQ